MHKSETHVETVDSGSYKPYAHIPELTMQVIGPPPAKAPFRVEFVTYMTRENEPANTHDACASKAIHLRALKRVRDRFCGRAFWVHPDGTLHEKAPLWSSVRWFGGGVTVKLLIDFGDSYTELSGLHLPAQGQIEKLDIGLSCDPWRLNITREGEPKWRDRILFDNARFLLWSVYQEYEKGQKK